MDDEHRTGDGDEETDGEEADGERTDGRFLVTHADDDSAVLQDVETSGVHTLSENPSLETGDVLEATITPEPPMEVTWQVDTIETKRHLSVEESPEPPTKQTQTVAHNQAVGEFTRRERAGEGEIHVLTVPEEGTEAAVEDVVDDEATLLRAARLGVRRVEVRHEPGIVSVRYLP
ncbi:MAG: DUF5812 family protein [Natronomonas sp.]